VVRVGAGAVGWHDYTVSFGGGAHSFVGIFPIFYMHIDNEATPFNCDKGYPKFCVT